MMKTTPAEATFAAGLPQRATAASSINASEAKAASSAAQEAMQQTAKKLQKENQE